MPPHDVATLAPTAPPRTPGRAPARMQVGAILALGACALLIMGAALPWVTGQPSNQPPGAQYMSSLKNGANIGRFLTNGYLLAW